jgi:hypothetical protein
MGDWKYSFTLCSEESLQYQLYRKFGGPRAWLDEKKIPAPVGNWNLGLPAPSLVTMLPELSRMA